MPPADTPPRTATLPPGYDEEDPYADEDLSEYPEWWLQNIELFREYGLRPYRPSRFSDGSVAPAVIEELETEYDLSICLRSVNPQNGRGWEIWIEDEPVRRVDHTRESGGYTRYALDSDEFRAIVESWIEGGVEQDSS